MKKKMTLEEFIEKARKIHGNKYDYSKVEYINSQTKVCIICSTHGEFFVTPNNHLQGRGCPKCKTAKMLERTMKTTEIFIKEAIEIHGNKYDYSKVEYKGAHTKICVICPKHGEFWITPHSHLQGRGCRLCANEKKSKNKIKPYSQLLDEFKKIHQEKYTYLSEEESNYIDAKHKINIICPIHGMFQITPNSHLNGCGCSKCSKKYKYTTEEFISESRRIHNNEYIYDETQYINSKTKVCIICPKHGEFWQTPSSHLSGCGCPKCNSSKLENEIRGFLIEHNIEFEEQKHFEWLKQQTLDFYLPQYNIAIECQGIQHFEDKHFNEKLEINQERDERKRKLCEENNIKILYYSNLGIQYPYKVYENKENLMEEINLNNIYIYKK